MSASKFSKPVLLGLAVGLSHAYITDAHAQTVTLPEITVSAPSPILPVGGSSSPNADQLPIGVMPVTTDSFSSVTIVPKNEIAREQPKTLGEALADKPGISGTTYAPGGADRPIIRGLDANRVSIVENGVGIHDVSSLGEDHGVPVNPLIADQIEVVRGPATLRYGSQAIGGVVSVENNRIPKAIPEKGITGQFLGGLNSVNSGRDGAFTVDAGSGSSAIHLDGFRSASGDYQTPLGRQRNSATSSSGGAVGYSYIFDQGFIGVSYSHYESLYHIPGADSADSRTRLDPYQDRVQVQGEYRFVDGPFQAFRFWLNGSDYKHNEIGLNGGVDGIQATFKQREAEARFELQYTPIQTALGVFTGASGIQLGQSQINTSGDAGSLLSPATTRPVAAYLFEQLALGNGYKLQAAGRIEGVSATGTATLFPDNFLPNGNPLTDEKRERDFLAKSASFGVLKDLPFDFVGSLTGQYVERAPSAAELYSHGAHDAPGTFEIGDPNLKLERARSLEIGLRRSEGKLRVDASAYYTRYAGFIYRRLTGQNCGNDFDSCGVDTDYKQIVYSQQDARFMGADVGLQYDAFSLNRGILGFAPQFDFVRAKFDDGTNVPRIPPYRVGGGIYWRGDDGIFAKVNLLHAFSHTDIAPNETQTPGYTNLKAELSYKIKPPKDSGFTDLTIGVVGNNLLNQQIRNSTSFKKDEILMPGRTVRAFVSAKF